MKRKYVLFCLAVLLLGLTACGSSGNEDSETDTAQENTEGSAEETSGYDPVLYEDLTSTLVSLGPYKGLEAQRAVTAVTDEDVQAEVDAIKKEYSQLETVDRAAQEGDVVVIDFTGYVDGETSDSLQGTEYSLELGSGEMVPGFEDQLIGAVADETREISLTFPEEYYEEVAGKDAVFEVYVHEVQEYVLHDWSDVFVCAVGSTDSDRKRITACPAYELLYFFRTGVALMSGFHNDFVLDTSQSTQLSLNNYAMSMRVLNDFLGDLDVLLERFGGSVDHNGGKSAVDTGFAGLKAIAMIQMQRDRNIRILNHCRLY